MVRRKSTVHPTTSKKTTTTESTWVYSKTLVTKKKSRPTGVLVKHYGTVFLLGNEKNAEVVSADDDGGGFDVGMTDYPFSQQAHHTNNNNTNVHT